MTDRKPPRLVAGEQQTLLALLQYQRQSLVRKVEGLDDDQAGRRLVGSDTTLLWLVEHVTQAELLWVVHRFVGAAPGLDERCRGLPEDEPPANLRWVLMHLLEETARHAGHADILRELVDGQTGR